MQFFQTMILPWITLALLFAAFYIRLTRNQMLETLGEDYIRTARAKGLPEKIVIGKHGLRAGLTPIVTAAGLDLAGLLGGAIIVESVFTLPGPRAPGRQRRCSTPTSRDRRRPSSSPASSSSSPTSSSTCCTPSSTRE